MVYYKKRKHDTAQGTAAYHVMVFLSVYITILSIRLPIPEAFSIIFKISLSVQIQHFTTDIRTMTIDIFIQKHRNT